MTAEAVFESDVTVRVMLRPVASPLPLGFLALVLATTVFSAVQLGWVAPDQARIAAITALAATVPLQFAVAVMGFLARDPVAVTGMGLLAGTWAVVGLTTVTAVPGTVSPGLGVLLLAAGIGMLVPAAAALSSKVAPALVMGLAGCRFAVTGAYQLDGGAAWKSAAGWTGLLLAVVALYTALALQLEAGAERTVLPVGRRGAGRLPQDTGIRREAGVRPQL
jgi:succinate-acetate transporter protein